jgi:hypothetical protein
MKIQEYYNALNLNETRQVHDCADNWNYLETIVIHKENKYM